MATYFVEINAHFLVKIEFDGSCCGAEHYFLDKYEWAWGANAYDEKAMKTDCFRGALLFSEIVSENELAQRFEELSNAKAEVQGITAEYNKATEEVKRLEAQLLAAREQAQKAFVTMRTKEGKLDALQDINYTKRPN